jgi:uncharacterized protein
MADVSSPCVKICVLDPQHKLCLGCGRSMAEIGGWLRFSDHERQQVKKQLGARLRTMKAAS